MPGQDGGERGAGEAVTVEVRAGVAVVGLNRPEKRNALTPDSVDALCRALQSAVSAQAAVVLTGAGGVFCGGFDLRLCHERAGTLAHLLHGLARAITILRASEKPVVVAAQGAAIAGGCALLGGADFVVTNAAALLGYPVTPLGISPAVSAPYLAQRIGTGAARERLLDPGLIDGVEAARIGLVDECIENAEDVLARAVERAQSFAAKPPHAFAATKRLLREMEDLNGASRGENALWVSVRLAENAEQRQALFDKFGAVKPLMMY